MFRLAFFVAFLFTGLNTSSAQWEIEESHTAADLRGIHALGNGVAWASGTGATVLRTTDDGARWQRCATPRNAEHLDFRGIQAFDASTAIVMSSGKGPLSRLYKTTDACQTWKLVAMNPDKGGFWDATKPYSDIPFGQAAPASENMLILGDAVHGQMKLWKWTEGWEERELEPSYDAPKIAIVGEFSFAASNSVLQIANTPKADPTWKFSFRWASGTAEHSYMSYYRVEETDRCEPCRAELGRVEVPMSDGTPSSGVFSFDFRTDLTGVAVGGDYARPNDSAKTAALTADGGLTWTAPVTPPHGYRSAVAYSPTTKTWITVGPNGTDISTDDGGNWRPIRPNPALDESPDADQHWNALSLPFVVGPHGRIGKFNPNALLLAGIVEADVSPVQLDTQGAHLCCTTDDCKNRQVLPNLQLVKSTHLFGVLRDQSGAPFKRSRVELRRWVSATEQVSLKVVTTDDSGHFDMGQIEAGKYRFLPSPTGAFRQPDSLPCPQDECPLELVLQVNPTDTAESVCPIR